MHEHELIRSLGLAPHPEGGLYRECFRSSLTVDTPRGPRSASTAIYYLLRAGERSLFHRVQSDEIWHHYAGAPLRLHLLPVGEVELAMGQAVVPAGAWQAAEPMGAWTLVGCTVAPGFDFADWELGKREELLREFPSEAARIERLTRSSG
jgi:uncharacterized protein